MVARPAVRLRRACKWQCSYKSNLGNPVTVGMHVRRYKGGRNLAGFQSPSVCLTCGGWATFLALDLLSKHQMPHTGLSYRVHHSG